MKNCVKERKKKQLSAWSIMNIINFEGKVKIKFVFTFYFMSFWPVQLGVTVHWYSPFLVDFSWISCLENGSKKVNLPIFAVLNMLEPALDEENRTVVTCLRWLPNSIRIHTNSNGLFQKKSKPNRWHGWGRNRISKGIEKRGKSRCQLKKKWNFHRSVHKKLMWND